MRGYRRPTRIGRLGVLVVCALVAGGTAASLASTGGHPRSSPLKPLHTDLTGIAVDDRYEIFYGLHADHLTVRDTKTRHSRAYQTGCRPPAQDSFAHGYLLLNCSTPETAVYQVLTVSTRSATDVPHIPQDVKLSGVGRYWVAGARGNPDGSGQEVVYINWHTGETKSYPGPYSLNPARDLNDPQLRLRPPGRERGDGFPRRRGPYVLTQPSKGPKAGQLFLRRGSTKVRLSRCRTECQFVDIVPGLVSWAERSVVRGYALPSGRRLRWPRHGTLLRPAVLATRYELVITSYTEDPETVPDASVRIFTTRWRESLK